LEGELEPESVLAFYRALKKTQAPGAEETILYDQETGKAYRIRVTVEDVPAYLRQSYSDRYGFAAEGNKAARAASAKA
jgi:hypothetical protein